MEGKVRRLSDVTQPAHDESSYHERRQRRRVQWLVENAVGRVLEIGCADGYILSQCLGRGHVGVDWDAQRIRRARAKFPDLTFFCLDVRFGLPFESGSFDTVLLPDILEHLFFTEASELLDEACRVARERVLVTLPWMPSFGANRDLVESLEHRWPPTPELVNWLLREYQESRRELDGFLLILIWRKPVEPAKAVLNIGCNRDIRLDAVNIDVRHLNGVDLVLDVRKGLPFSDGSVDRIVAHHFLEHLSLDEASVVVRDWHRVLRVNGICEVCVPDVFLGAQMARLGQWTFSEWLGALYGAEETHVPAQQHRWGYTGDTVGELCRAAGFREVRRLDAKNHNELDGKTREQLKAEWNEPEPSCFVTIEAIK